MKALIVRFVRQEEGQNLVEYALLAGLVAIVAIAVLGEVGTNVNTIFTSVRDALAKVP
jgi:pilus assembly protein Flp/PilA